jgi:hypothetical protein
MPNLGGLDFGSLLSNPAVMNMVSAWTIPSVKYTLNFVIPYKINIVH